MGYALVGHAGHEQVVGLNLGKIELGQAAALIADFRNLHLLSLRDCQLTDISFLLGLNNLELLDLRQNEITQLPEAFMQWGLEIDVSEEYGSGHNIYLYGNPLEKPPLEIIKQGNTAIQAYFDSLKADTLPLNGVKVPLVSESVTWKTSPVSAINKRWQVLNDLDQRISDSHTLEKDLHRLMETNLWILGTEYDRLSSDESLKTQVEEYLGKEYRGARARKRPDLVLARDSGQRFLLLELKKPGHILDRHDGAQAQTYADELNQYLPQVKIEVVVLGGKVDSTLTARNQGQEVKYLSYRQVVSNARKSLEWLLVDMRKD